MVQLLKPATFLAGLLPLTYSLYQVWLLQAGGEHQLGADPAKALVLIQGEWTIRFLILTLLISPLRKLFGLSSLQRIRRMLGLFTFFYASLHLAAYVVLLLELDLSDLAAEIVKRPYVTAGIAAWILLLPLAVSSTNKMMRRLGNRWSQLHRAIYGVALLAVLHVFWLSRSSYFDAFLYGSILLSLLFYRVLQGKLQVYRDGIRSSS